MVRRWDAVPAAAQIPGQDQLPTTRHYRSRNQQCSDGRFVSYCTIGRDCPSSSNRIERSPNYTIGYKDDLGKSAPIGMPQWTDSFGSIWIHSIGQDIRPYFHLQVSDLTGTSRAMDRRTATGNPEFTPTECQQGAQRPPQSLKSELILQCIKGHDWPA
jgi:hypothetical protein